MNILLAPSAFLPNVGGVEQITLHLAREYNAAGHTAAVLTNRWPDSLPEHERVQDIVTHRLHMFTPNMNPASWPRFLTAVKFNSDAMLRIIEAGRYEIIHIMSAGPNAFYAQTAARLAGLPLVNTFQGSDLRIYARDSRFARWALRRTLNQSAAITACSHDLLDEAVGANPRWRAKARVVYNGVDPEEFDPARELEAYRHPRPYVFAMGRLLRIKGFDLLIRGFAEFLHEFPDYDLIIAGDGEEREPLEKLARELGIEKRVRFWGWADREDAVRLLLGAGLAVCPSRQEGMGIICLEAGLARKPVVAARVGGIPEVVEHAVNGLLFDPEDVPGLVEAMARAAGDPDLAERLGAAGRARALERFAWPAIAGTYLDIYKSARAGHLRRPRFGG